MSMRLPALCLLLLAAPSVAQVGVYRDDDTGDGRPQGTVTITGAAGRQRYIPPVYTVRRGDTLWDVTGRYYGNPWEWPRVWSYNPEITNPHWIYPLDQLRLLPQDEVDVVEDPSGPAIVVRRPRARSESLYLRQEGFIDPRALEASGRIAGSPEDHMLLAPPDEVYVQFEEDFRGTPRGEMTIFRPIPSRERVAAEEGSLVRIFGTLRIESYDAERRQARATLLEATDPIERGFQVAPIPRRFETVEPRVADRDLQTEVIALLEPRVMVASRQLVFLPVGAEQGVQRGFRFFMTRVGDGWRDTLPGSDAESVGPIIDPGTGPREYPTEIIAEGRVVDVQAETSAVMITESTLPLQVGDLAEMRQGY
jgi:hypothetical protein